MSMPGCCFQAGGHGGGAIQLGAEGLAHGVGDAGAAAGGQLTCHGMDLGVLDVHAHGLGWVETLM
jgi:hypothetical protein